MAFEIGPVAGVSPTLPTGYLKPAGASATDGSAFANALGGAVDQVQSLQATSNDLSIKAVTGDLTDIHAATLASTRSAVALEMVSTFRNRGVEAFNEIMRMQA
ncbi:flagellar hook-basal body complex protein FliE [Paeniglutamicibacter sp. ABSL32-1]|jgi:flagellar hook-basal body complex protein FliE|uniref:flagellar hook-basal body complex protein FliE n=1 Tax=Paeniglutamicibacter TaxID=1742990 RepID=UPI001C2D0A44|nr:MULTISPECIES: flagellar hook-basal body complex protein FliE [Paeniglutamicibacter]MBV1780004.1 flagellar hook-basal body complex protein FliE [Paeniglutamicibacter quisquiliarum]MDO2935577.1 flagellar hook-basal body complex protein FliE [Paeniglutamicibacter sulfureus]